MSLTNEVARGIYFGLLLTVMILFGLFLLSKPRERPQCASRWEGEVVEWRQGEDGRQYCHRVNYRAQRRT